MTTARALITRSMRKARIIGKNETPSADEVADGLVEFNSMLGMMSNNSMLIYARTLEPFTLTAGDGDYTIGVGANFNTARPMYVVSAYIREGSTDHPLTIKSDEAFAAIVNKSATGMPEVLNFNNAYSAATINLHPKPASAYTLYILSEKALTEISTLDTVLSFPPGWEDALMYNLAVRLSPEYGQTPDELTLKFAEDGMEMIERTIRRNQNMDWNTPASGGNIYTGYW